MILRQNANYHFDGTIIEDPTNIRWFEPGELIIETGTNIQPFVSITAKKFIKIGHHCLIAAGVCIVDHDHLMNENLGDIVQPGEALPIIIGHHTWIGSNAVILKGVTLGDYCVVGAGAVVTHSFPDKSVIVGNPAKLLRTR